MISYDGFGVLGKEIGGIMTSKVAYWVFVMSKVQTPVRPLYVFD